MLILETATLTITVIEDRIFHLFIKDFCSATYSDMNDVFVGVSSYCSKNYNIKYGMLLIELGHGANIEQDAREFTATKKANKFTRGSAILVKNASQKLLGEYYIRFNRPVYTNKVFLQET